ncbi:MAG: hypothetical protein OXB91_08830 [Bryobacterales bacterium]|nr:hypothetical protein [Bryobacterales bacterium]
MADWFSADLRFLGVLITFFALLATLAYRWLSEHRRDFHVLLERIDKEAERRERETREIIDRIDKEAAERQRQIDKEAAERQRQIDKEAAERQRSFNEEAEKRERATQAALERSDRAFESLTKQTNLQMEKLAGIAERTARSEATLETLTGRRPRAGSTQISAEDEPRSVAAQEVPGEPPAE